MKTQLLMSKRIKLETMEGRLTKQGKVKENSHPDDRRNDGEEFQDWWSSMVDNRQRLRKKKRTQRDGLTLAQRILNQRQGKEKDDLPLGTSASDLHHEELCNRQRTSSRAHSLSPTSDKKYSRHRTRSYSNEGRNISQRKNKKENYNKDNKKESEERKNKKENYSKDNKKESQESGYLDNEQSSSTSDYSTSTETDSDSSEEEDKVESNSELERQQRYIQSKRRRLTSTRPSKALIITSNIRDKNQYVSCEYGSVSKGEVSIQRDMQAPQDKYNNVAGKGEQTHSSNKEVHITHSDTDYTSEDKSGQIKKDQSHKKQSLKKAVVVKRVSDHKQIPKDESKKNKIIKSEPVLSEDKSSAMETPREKEHKSSSKESITSKPHLDNNLHKNKWKSNENSSKDHSDKLNSPDQYPLPASHPPLPKDNNKHKLHRKHKHERKGLKDKSRDPTASVPIIEGSSREQTHISSYSLPENGANSVLPEKSNWVSWDSDEGDANETNPRKSGVDTLPRLMSRHSESRLLRHTPVLNTHREQTKLPEINNFDRPSLVNQRSDSVESNSSPWAEKTPIPDHLKHLSNDYTPIRVSSLPGSTSQDRINIDKTRRHSSPNPREPRRRNTTSPYVSKKFKQAKIDIDIERMERKVNRDLKEIIHKFRDKSLDVDSEGW